MSPVGSRNRGSGSSFCVSPIDDTDQLPRHKRNDSWASARASGPQSLRDTSPSPEVSHHIPKAVHFAPSHDDLSGDPSHIRKANQVKPQVTSSHKSSSSHTSNFMHWGREQFHSKKKLTKTRNRNSSFSRSEPPVQPVQPVPPETRSQSSSRVSSLGEHSNKHFGAEDGGPKLDTLGFVPSVVTTITAGDSEASPERPDPKYPPKSSRRYVPHPLPEPKFGAAFDMMQTPQPAVVNTVARTGSPLEDLNDSPRGSLNVESGSTDNLTIMSRRHPLPTSMPISKKPVRKPTPSEAIQAPAVAQPPDDRPKDPQSRIESLETRRDELARRRFNLETVLKELTRVIQPQSYAYDQAAKAEVKRSVQSIENEIAEIKREEHELGMKVTRAWRRLDEKENNGDGSNLWVKRVTS